MPNRSVVHIIVVDNVANFGCIKCATLCEGILGTRSRVRVDPLLFRGQAPQEHWQIFRQTAKAHLKLSNKTLSSMLRWRCCCRQTLESHVFQHLHVVHRSILGTHRSWEAAAAMISNRGISEVQCSGISFHHNISPLRYCSIARLVILYKFICDCAADIYRSQQVLIVSLWDRRCHLAPLRRARVNNNATRQPGARERVLYMSPEYFTPLRSMRSAQISVCRCVCKA